MKRRRVLMTREEIVPDRLAGTTAVVDVFLATTTLPTSLENGARRIFPVVSVEGAEDARERLVASSVLRGGEQNSERIEGYGLGPFPEEYPREIVAGKDVIFVTTNGTRATTAAPAGRVLLGCLRNAPAVARHLEASETDSIYLTCADGRFALDDFFGTAAILSSMNMEGWHLNDARGQRWTSWSATGTWRRHCSRDGWAGGLPSIGWKPSSLLQTSARATLSRRSSAAGSLELVSQIACQLVSARRRRRLVSISAKA